MTTQEAQVHAQIEAVITRLTGPGGRFEIVPETVLGVTMPVMRRRGRAVGDLMAASRAWGDRDYLVTADRRISYAEHLAAVAALATALRDDLGVRAGDRVAILAANSPEWVIAFWATQCLGAISVGLNGWWTPRETDYALRHCRPSVLIVDAKRAESLTGLDTSGIAVLTVESDVPRLIAARAGAELPRAEVDEDDPAVLLYTSGTSGKPKGALHSQRNVLAVADYHRFSDAFAIELSGHTYTDTEPSPLRYLLTSPLFHIASLHNLVVPRLATGSAVVMHQGAFDVPAVLGLIDRERVTNWAPVPTMAGRLLACENLDDYDLSSLTAFALASAPSSIALQDRLRERFAFARDALVDSYGLTECSTAIAVATSADLEQAPGTLGRPILTVDLEIRDPFGVRVPDGTEGEVCVRSPFVMLRYWEDEAATAAAISPDRWLRTGDFGVLEAGRLRLVGRRSDLILRGGENVYPTEIEQCLEEHPEVLECAVIGVPHEDLGQEVAAVVVVRPGTAADEPELHQFAAGRLAYFKVPSRWLIRTEALPRNATGKVIRRSISL
ncbi:class I adenylate-forming enzyme family protein [Nocardia stercoris]|uniref:Long-chain fatty acid--CoA ligase n=1 Tax=Nocardia stercoris TaxID=2483361 RepID=A0A3M2KSD5_9NOCA|nr:class I adenylate-forming enzyme family protein [Nocardia stercoris]RMI28562.1 long-chain fatty acid--CoA ligase [Nocardia stercoris]